MLLSLGNALRSYSLQSPRAGSRRGTESSRSCYTGERVGRISRTARPRRRSLRTLLWHVHITTPFSCPRAPPTHISRGVIAPPQRSRARGGNFGPSESAASLLCASLSRVTRRYREEGRDGQLQGAQTGVPRRQSWQWAAWELTPVRSDGVTRYGMRTPCTLGDHWLALVSGRHGEIHARGDALRDGGAGRSGPRHLGAAARSDD